MTDFLGVHCAITERSHGAPLTERQVQQAIYRKWRSRCRLLLPNYTPRGWHECDMWAVTKAGYANEFEIKLTVSDFKADAKKLTSWAHNYVDGKYVHQPKRTKHERLEAGDVQGPVRFWYVTPAGLLANAERPSWAGLIEVEYGRFGLRIIARADGPRLHNARTDESIIRHAFAACYYRFWNARIYADKFAEAHP